MSIERQAVVDALRAEDVAAHYQITGRWHGRWLRSRRCPKDDHSTDAMGLARDGKWHCWSCDLGGDLFTLIAIAEKLDARADFGRVLEIAAGIAGVVDESDFGGGGKPSPPTRPPPPELPPLADRIASAKKRAAWVWGRLCPFDRAARAYLSDRCLPPDDVLRREELKSTPMRVTTAELARQAVKGDDALSKLARMLAKVGVAIPVRSVSDGALVDVRCRRLDPREFRDESGTLRTEPKVIGMLGGIVREKDELLGCYGRPHELELSDGYDTIVVVEGWADYLTAMLRWPQARVLGSVDAGSYPLVAGLAGAAIAERGSGRVILVAQWDGEDGAADRAVNVASKRAISLVGPKQVEWYETKPYKDLNDLVRSEAADRA